MAEKKYFDLLELSEDASQEDIRKAYDKILVRAAHDESIDMKVINKAYAVLTGTVKKELSVEEKKAKEKKLKMQGMKPFIIIGGILVAVILAIAIPSMINKTPDLQVTFLGGYTLSDNYLNLENHIEGFDDIKDVEISGIFLSSESGEMDAGGRIALSGMLSSGDADIIIASKEGLDYLLTDDLSLMVFNDTLLSDIGISKDDERLIYNDDKSAIYGIDVGEFTLVTHSITGEGETILVIAKKTNNYELVVETIKLILEDK